MVCSLKLAANLLDLVVLLEYHCVEFLDKPFLTFVLTPQLINGGSVSSTRVRGGCHGACSRRIVHGLAAFTRALRRYHLFTFFVDFEFLRARVRRLLTF